MGAPMRLSVHTIKLSRVTERKESSSAKKKVSAWMHAQGQLFMEKR